jgi:hypothetical protein
MNQVSEARQRIRVLERNPEIQAIAAGTYRACGSACRKRAERRQVCGLPHRDAVITKVRNQYAFPIEGYCLRGWSGLPSMTGAMLCEKELSD